MQTRWQVITGAPSSGKTTLISQLAKQGFETHPETARVYIDQEAGLGRTIHDLRQDEYGFQSKIFAMNVELEAKLNPSSFMFLDRAIPDSIAFYKLSNFDDKEVRHAANAMRYEHVFLLETLPFDKDYARAESEEEAKYIHKLLLEAYTSAGYQVIAVPALPIEERAEFVLSHIKSPSKERV